MIAKLLIELDTTRLDHLQATLTVEDANRVYGTYKDSCLVSPVEARGWAYSLLVDLGYQFETEDWEQNGPNTLFHRVSKPNTFNLISVLDAINNSGFDGGFGWGGKVIIDLEDFDNGKVFHNGETVVTGLKYGDPNTVSWARDE